MFEPMRRSFGKLAFEGNWRGLCRLTFDAETQSEEAVWFGVHIEECSWYSHYSWTPKARFAWSVKFPVHTPGFILMLQLMPRLAPIGSRRGLEASGPRGLVLWERWTVWGGIAQPPPAPPLCFVVGRRSCERWNFILSEGDGFFQPLDLKTKYPRSECGWAADER